MLRIDSEKPNMEEIKTAAELIRRGGIVAFPTETVYGLGANALNTDAVQAVFDAKNRPHDNPPIVHVSNVSDAHRLAKRISARAEALMNFFWPGPLTLILERSEIVPCVTVSGLDTIAIRMPKNNVALALIRESGCPIAAPSANLAGKPSPTLAKHVLDDLDGRIDAVLDAGPTDIGVESTVLDLTTDPPQILRPGGTSYEVLMRVLGRVELNPAAIADAALPIGKIRSPGVQYTHYAPHATMVIVEGDVKAIIDKVNELAELYGAEGKRVGVLATDETAAYYRQGVVKSLGSRREISSTAKSLFRLLREFDEEEVEVIIAEGVPSEGLGLAVMNRLRRASGFRIIKAV